MSDPTGVNVMPRLSALGSRLNMRMPLTIVLMIVSPLMMSSRNTMYMWTTANSSRYHMPR